MREHLQKYHAKEWEDTVVEKELKGWEAIVKQRKGKAPQSDDQAAPTNYSDGGFTLEGFMKRLARFLVVDDQVMCLITLCLISHTFEITERHAYTVRTGRQPHGLP